MLLFVRQTCFFYTLTGCYFCWFPIKSFPRPCQKSLFARVGIGKWTRPKPHPTSHFRHLCGLAILPGKVQTWAITIVFPPLMKFEYMPPYILLFMIKKTTSTSIVGTLKCT